MRRQACLLFVCLSLSTAHCGAPPAAPDAAAPRDAALDAAAPPDARAPDAGDAGGPRDAGFGAVAWGVSLGGGDRGGNHVPSAVWLGEDGAAHLAVHYEGSIAFDDETTWRATWIDFALARYAPSGALEWARRGFGGGGEMAHDLVMDASGDLVLLGAIHARCEEGPPDCAGYRHLTLGEGQPGEATLEAAGSIDLHLSRFDASGEYLGSTQLGAAGAALMGSALARDQAGRLIVAGTFDGALPIPGPPGGAETVTGESDVFITRLGDGGASDLRRVAGGPDEGALDRVLDAAPTGDGGFLLGGATDGVFRLGEPPRGLDHVTTSPAHPDGWAARFDADGELVWAVVAASPLFASVSAVLPTPDGGAWISGTHFDEVTLGARTVDGGGAFLARVAPDGEVTFAQSTGASSMSVALAPLPEGRFAWLIAAAASVRLPSSDPAAARDHSVRSESDGLLLRYDAEGELLGVLELGREDGDSICLPTALHADASGRLLVAGRFAEEVTIGRGRADAVTLRASVGHPGFLARVDP